MKRVLQLLTRQSNHLDNLGLINLANDLDDCIFKLADDMKLVEPTPEIYANKLLEKHKINPTGKIGKGAYGAVYSANINGHPVAVKVTDAIHEVDNWNEIKDIVEKSPPDIRRHFPQIFEAETDSIAGHQLAIIVMERLAPLDSKTHKALFGKITESGNSERHTPIEQLLAKGDLWDGAVKYATSELEIQNPSELAMILKSAKFQEHNLSDKILEVIMSYSNEHNNVISPADAFTISQKLHQYIDNVSHAGNFPHDMGGEHDQPWISEIPEAKSLYGALKFLEAKGMVWQDVSYENVMTRPGTGDTVIVDVGMFYSEAN